MKRRAAARPAAAAAASTLLHVVAGVPLTSLPPFGVGALFESPSATGHPFVVTLGCLTVRVVLGWALGALTRRAPSPYPPERSAGENPVQYPLGADMPLPPTVATAAGWRCGNAAAYSTATNRTVPVDTSDCSATTNFTGRV